MKIFPNGVRLADGTRDGDLSVRVQDLRAGSKALAKLLRLTGSDVEAG
jgi:hypothetical protein